MLLAPLVIVIPGPAVKVAAIGAPEADPMINCPLEDNCVIAGIPLVPVVRTPLFAEVRPATTFAEEE